jgi:hypothetical protein
MIVGGELSLPDEIVSRDGRSFMITHPADAHISEAYSNTVMLSVRDRGIVLLGIDAIQPIQHEPEAVAGGPSPGTCYRLKPGDRGA